MENKIVSHPWLAGKRFSEKYMAYGKNQLKDVAKNSLIRPQKDLSGI